MQISNLSLYIESFTMNKIINFIKNSWTLRTVGVMTLIHVVLQLVFEQKFEISSIIIFFLLGYILFGDLENFKKKSAIIRIFIVLHISNSSMYEYKQNFYF